MRYREEHDYLGDVAVPYDAYWGAQTQRAIDNFPISGIKPIKEYTYAIILIKKAAAEANYQAGLISRKISRAIVRAADEALAGNLDDQFVVDIYQAGEGTSNNMNVNEVLANRAIELLGGNKGDYSLVHPNDHVNMGQSSNDVIPTAIKIAAMKLVPDLLSSMSMLSKEFALKGKQFDSVIKSGRTHMMDAAPIRLGQEFMAWSDLLNESIKRIDSAAKSLLDINLGATAVGTGVNADPIYTKTAIIKLSSYTGLKLRKATDLPAVTESPSDLMALSSALRIFSADMTKISNDIRLMNSGPITGLAEITLPAVQPGSSIMPGKVNPSVIEMMNMVCFRVIGDDDTVTLATQAGQLELNVMEPLIAYCLLHDLKILRNAIDVFTERAIKGLKVNKRKMESIAYHDPGMALLLNPYIGYEKAARLVKKAVAENKSIKEVANESGLLDKKLIDKIFDPYSLTTPKRLKRR
jgi:aspartate ammonia-lyase